MELKARERRSAAAQVVEMIRSKIIRGELKPHDRLPTMTEMGKDLGVGVFAVRRAIKELKEDGLVNPIVGQGVFVAESDGEKKLGMVAVVESIVASDRGFSFKNPRTTGAIQEHLGQLGATACMISPVVEGPSAEQFRRSIVDNFDGVIWLFPTAKHWDTIDALAQAGMPMVLTSPNERVSRYPCVESDLVGAGHAAGRYFLENNCSEVTLFWSEPQEEEADQHAMPHKTGSSIGCRLALSQVFTEGVARAGGAPSGLEVVELPYEGADECRQIISDRLQNAPAGSGVFIVCTWGFLDWLAHDPAEVAAVLDKHKVIAMVANKEYGDLGPLAELIELQTIAIPHETMGRHAVGILSRLVENGKEEPAGTTTTLVHVRFGPYQANLNVNV